MHQKLNQQTPETFSTFAAPAVATGSLTQAEFDAAIALLVEASNPNPPAPKQDRLNTFTETGKQLGVCGRTAKRMFDDGELEGRRLRQGAPNTLRIYQSSIDAILTPDSRKEVISQPEGAERS